MKFLSTPKTMCCCASWHFMQSQSRIQCKEMRSKMVQGFCSSYQFSCAFQCQEQFSRDLCIWISWGGLSFFWLVLEAIPSPIIPFINLYQSISIYINLYQSISIYINLYQSIIIYIHIKHDMKLEPTTGIAALPRPQGMPLLDAVLEKKVRLGSNDELLGYITLLILISISQYGYIVISWYIINFW